jgi:hypothetical protein
VSRRGRVPRTGRFAERDGRSASNPWVIRVVAIVAGAVVVVALVYAAVNGFLFSLPSR